MIKFPIGIQTFSEIIEENYYYVDKSSFIKKLVDNGKYFFLSRPRRFGKSLFLSTMESAFKGEIEFFKGLYLEKNWDWNTSYPVIKISFGSGVHRNVKELQESFLYALTLNEDTYTIDVNNDNLKNRFSELIQKLSKKYSSKVVVLIDEYDKPILDNITDIPTATAIREELKNYYSVLKDADQYLKLVFITGVSKFSKVSLFSGLNNIKDITIDPRFFSICGYTQKELETVFEDALQGLDMGKIKLWYNGYNFGGNEGIYNPWDILLYLDSKIFKNYWFESATPSFLIKLIEKNRYFIPGLENVTASEKILSSFDVENIDIITLLFQTGYLTIKKSVQLGNRLGYTLSWPNLEVKMSLTDHILSWLTHKTHEQDKEHLNLYNCLLEENIEKLKDLFHSFYASIPSDWYRKNSIAHYEGYYASIFYTYFTALGLDTRGEDFTSTGRIDLTVVMDHAVYIFEFKVLDLDKSGTSALEQIKKKKYHEKYTSLRLPIYCIGMEFSGEERNITGFAWEKSA